MDVSVFSALVAGLLSFLSPCVLPLVPGYISMLSGIGVEQLKEGEGATGRLLTSALAFVIGFSIVFITFGASATAVGAFLVKNRNMLAPIAGALIVLFGLHLVGWLVKISVRAGLAIGALLVLMGIALTLGAVLTLHFLLIGLALLLFAVAGIGSLEQLRLRFVALGLFSWLLSTVVSADFTLKSVHFYALSPIFLIGPVMTRWLNRDVHLRNVGGNKPGMVSGFLMGFAFAFGWTPCIGPILAFVLAMAATRETVMQGVFLLAVYSAGLAIPFLVTALLIGRFMKFYQRFRKHLHTVEVLSGVLLLVIGGLIFVNRLTWLSGKLTFLNRFAQ